MSYFPFTFQQYYGTLWPSSQFKSNLLEVCQHLTNTSICTDGRESSSQSNPWTAHPNTSKSFSFKFTGNISWENSFLPLFVNALSLILVTVYIACNELNAQKPKWSRKQLITAQNHHDQKMGSHHHTWWEVYKHMEVTNKYPDEFLRASSHLAVALQTVELWAAVEPPCLQQLFFCSLQDIANKNKLHDVFYSIPIKPTQRNATKLIYNNHIYHFTPL